MNKKRVAVFIDNSNVFRNLLRMRLSSNNWIKQYSPIKLAEKLTGSRTLVNVYFYCSPPPPELRVRDRNKYQQQLDYYFKISQQPVKIRYATLTKNKGKYFEKNLDTQLVTDMIIAAVKNEYDTAIVIIANDGDFVSAIEAVQNLGKNVEIGYFKSSMSMNLRNSAKVMRRLRSSYFIHLK